MSGGSGKARGGKKKFIGHKGGHRHFTDYEELKTQQAQIRQEKEREGEESSDDEEGGKAEAGPASKTAKTSTAAKAENSSSSDASGSSDDDEDDAKNEKKGVQHLIEIENPNRVKQKMKKVTDIKIVDTSQMSRKEREAVEKEKARLEYQRLHALGKTDEAQADMARLQIIRKQREDAAKKRESERVAKEDAEKAQTSQKLAGVATMKP